jgi:enamine deaminase RidA (YjgF/YER057c/UK114 family)
MSKVNITTHELPGREYAKTGSPWEDAVGKCRAVRVRNLIFVSGTVGIELDGSFAPTVAEQTRRSLEIIRAAIEALGGKLSDVVRTRFSLTDISHWEEAGRIHAEIFRDVRPACAMVQVAALVGSALVEIEADAVLVANY